MANVRTGGQARRMQQPGVRSLPKRSKPSRKMRVNECDYGLLFMVIFIALFGFVIMLSAAVPDTSIAKKQVVLLVLGFISMFGLSYLNYHIFNSKFSIIIYLAGILSILALQFVGSGSHGATRWIPIGGFQFQPVELFKIAVILFNAYLLSSWGKRLRMPKNTVKYILLSVADLLIVYKFSQNLSSALIVFVICIGMLLVAGPNWKVCASFVILGVIAVIVFILYVCALDAAGMIVESPSKYWREYRVAMWLFPDKYSGDSKSFQTSMSVSAIISGGLKGKGLGNGTQKYYLPESQNDMVFAIVCEELGLAGATFLAVQYTLMMQRLTTIIRNSKDAFGSLVVTGVFVHLAVQVMLNIAVATGAMPNTGVTLPFVSYGGTALICSLAEIGLALSVSRHILLE